MFVVFLVVKGFILGGCIKGLKQVDVPLMWAGIYTVASTLLSFAFLKEINLLFLLLAVALRFFVGWGWFALLKKFDGMGLVYYLIMGAGALICIV